MNTATNNAVGAVLVCGVAGTALTSAERDFFRQCAPSGATLFAWNIPEDIKKTAELVHELQACRPTGAPPMVIAIDQEGGRVARLKKDFPNQGPAMRLAGGATDNEALNHIRDYAAELGRALLALGINVNFAPVLDILTEPANIAIGDRAFGTDVDPVCKRAGAFLEGLQSTGILGCLKHFPGQGDAKVDTHAGQALVDLPRKLLDERELIPFRALIPKSSLVMISHCIYPQLAAEEASRSPKIIGALLRGEMSYEGVVVSDDMNMGAMPQDSRIWQEVIVESVAAGVDMVLVCKHLDKMQLAYDALNSAAAKSKAFAQRLNEAASRVLKLREQLKPA